MQTVLISVGLFVVAVMLHLLYCRASTQKNLKAKLFIILALVNLVVFAAIAAANHMPLVLTATVIYILLVPAYLTFYVCTELTSPSKRILQVIAAGPCHYADILKALERENFIILRLEELEHSGCFRRDHELYFLTKSGQAIARALGVYQALLGRKVGG